jgi:hypothetical protein
LNLITAITDQNKRFHKNLIRLFHGIINEQVENNTSHPHGKHRGHQIQDGKEKLPPLTKRILIVDDDPDITFTFKKALTDFSCHMVKIEGK